jgi:hypothetical protein
MPYLYDIPAHIVGQVASQQASVFGAIIKDNVTGQIIAHMQPSSGLTQVLSRVTGIATSGFSPLDVVALVQNEQIKQGIAKLQNGMILMQNLQYGTLALSGLGLGISVAGFAATLARLKAIESRLDLLAGAMTQVTRDRRYDDIKITLAEISGDLQGIETLTGRRDPRPVAEQLQLSLTRSTRKIETHFRREAASPSLTLAQMDLLWTLAGAMRLCQEAALQALFMADELQVAQTLGEAETARQLALLDEVSPDLLSRRIAQGEPDPDAARRLRQLALGQARSLTNGLKGAVMALAGQSSLAKSLHDRGIGGADYIRELIDTQDDKLLCLLPQGHAS